MLIEETTVTDAALPVAVFRQHLRLGSGFAEDGLQDGLLRSFLRAALAAVESRTGKVLLQRDFRWTRPGWAAPGRQVLPVAPVAAVGLVELVDRDGQAEVLPESGWALEADPHRPALVSTGVRFPAPVPGGAVRVRFTAGFGPGWGDLPADLAQAVLLLAAHYYEYRHDTGLSGGCTPFGVTALIEPWRTLRLSMGGGA